MNQIYSMSAFPEEFAGFDGITPCNFSVYLIQEIMPSHATLFQIPWHHTHEHSPARYPPVGQVIQFPICMTVNNHT